MEPRKSRDWGKSKKWGPSCFFIFLSVCFSSDRLSNTSFLQLCLPLDWSSNNQTSSLLLLTQHIKGLERWWEELNTWVIVGRGWWSTVEVGNQPRLGLWERDRTELKERHSTCFISKRKRQKEGSKKYVYEDKWRVLKKFKGSVFNPTIAAALPKWGITDDVSVHLALVWSGFHVRVVCRPVQVLI